MRGCKEGLGSLPLILGGHSFGCRVAATAAGVVAAKGCIALGYPLLPKKAAESKARTAELAGCPVPIFFTSGEKDDFIPSPGALKRAVDAHSPVAANCHIRMIPRGNHGLGDGAAASKKSAAMRSEIVAPGVVSDIKAILALPDASSSTTTSTSPLKRKRDDGAEKEDANPKKAKN